MGKTLSQSSKKCCLCEPNKRWDPLQFCNRTAVLLPTTDAGRKYDQIKKQGFKHVYLGQEELTSIQYRIFAKVQNVVKM